MAYAWALFRAGASRLGAGAGASRARAAIRSRRGFGTRSSRSPSAHAGTTWRCARCGPRGPAARSIRSRPSCSRTRSCSRVRRRAAPSAIPVRGSRCARCASTSSAGRRGGGARRLARPRARPGALRFLHQYADLAAYYAWRGDAAQSVHWLERAVAHSPMLHRWQLGVRPVRQGAAHVRVRGWFRARASAGRRAASSAPRGDRRVSDVPRAAEFRCDVPTVERWRRWRRRRCPSVWSVRSQRP